MILNTSITGEPAFTGIVHKYKVKNKSMAGPAEVAAGMLGRDIAPTVDGASMPLAATIPPDGEGVICSPIQKFELDTPIGGGELKAPDNRFHLGEAVTLSRTAEGYLLIEREVVAEM